MGLDPVGFAAGSMDLYEYAGNDVTGLTDPTGLYSMPETGQEAPQFGQVPRPEDTINRIAEEGAKRGSTLPTRRPPAIKNSNPAELQETQREIQNMDETQLLAQMNRATRRPNFGPDQMRLVRTRLGSINTGLISQIKHAWDEFEEAYDNAFDQAYQALVQAGMADGQARLQAHRIAMQKQNVKWAYQAFGDLNGRRIAIQRALNPGPPGLLDRTPPQRTF